MALVKYGGGVVQMSGSIAGDTFARNRYGNYARARTKPTNPNTNRQVDVRSALSELTERWGDTLTVAQRTAWNTYASNVAMTNRLGETIHLTGFNHYIRSNAQLARQSYTLVDNGPVIFEVPAGDPALAVAISEATQQWTITYDDTKDWDNETGGYLFFSQGLPQNAQRNFFAGPWRNQGEVAGVTAAPVASPYVGALSWAVAAGQHMWLRARILRADGRISRPFFADAIVAA